MTGVTDIDRAYERARRGDRDGFAAWVANAELPLRRSLRSFAREVDVEALVQEALLRMWTLAPGLDLEGENASLRYALRLVRNLALREAKRMRRFVPIDLEKKAGGDASPGPGSDTVEEPEEDGAGPPHDEHAGAKRGDTIGGAIIADPPADPGLRRVILDCISKLPARNRQALSARLESGGETADRDLAAGLRMTLNTFLQNIVRARALLRRCLESRGVAIEERLS